ncbi:hypothetical protein V1477_017353, partial [Vespula maculifrons]
MCRLKRADGMGRGVWWGWDEVGWDKLSLKSSRRGTTYAPLLRSSPIQHHSWFLGYVRVSSRILVSRCRAEPPPITRDEFCYPTSGAKKKKKGKQRNLRDRSCDGVGGDGAGAGAGGGGGSDSGSSGGLTISFLDVLATLRVIFEYDTSEYREG